MSACQVCGVEDALGRHAGNCQRAFELGLPRLSEDEDPIPPEVEAEIVEDKPVEYEWPERSAMAEHDVGQWSWKGRVELWMAYNVTSDGDLVLFISEIDALRYAVQNGWKAKQVELGVSIRKQM